VPSTSAQSLMPAALRDDLRSGLRAELPILNSLDPCSLIRSSKLLTCLSSGEFLPLFFDRSENRVFITHYFYVLAYVFWKVPKNECKLIGHINIH